MGRTSEHRRDETARVAKSAGVPDSLSSAHCQNAKLEGLSGLAHETVVRGFPRPEGQGSGIRSPPCPGPSGTIEHAATAHCDRSMTSRPTFTRLSSPRPATATAAGLPGPPRRRWRNRYMGPHARDRGRACHRPRQDVVGRHWPRCGQRGHDRGISGRRRQSGPQPLRGVGGDHDGLPPDCDPHLVENEEAPVRELPPQLLQLATNYLLTIRH